MITSSENFRPKRVALLIQREVAKLIQTEYQDILKAFMTVVKVSLTRDLAYARIYVSVMGDESHITTCLTTLNEYAPHLRRALAKLLKLRTVPELHFYYDPSIQEGNRITALIDRANRPCGQ